MLLKALHSIQPERMLVEQIEVNPWRTGGSWTWRCRQRSRGAPVNPPPAPARHRIPQSSAYP
jgi:hypothetical protein